MRGVEKKKARQIAKRRRQKLQSLNGPIDLIKHFPAAKFRGAHIGGYWPLPAEMDVKPLLLALSEFGVEISLPCIVGKEKALLFRKWRHEDEMRVGHFSVSEPHSHQPEVRPSFVLVPLLAFTSDGKRLGYGGGFYDRTLAKLREEGDVFACGVAYAGQEVPDVPTDEHDQFLDGILTEKYFKVFA